MLSSGSIFTYLKVYLEHERPQEPQVPARVCASPVFQRSGLNGDIDFGDKRPPGELKSWNMFPEWLKKGRSSTLPGDFRRHLAGDRKGDLTFLAGDPRLGDVHAFRDGDPDLLLGGLSRLAITKAGFLSGPFTWPRGRSSLDTKPGPNLYFCPDGRFLIGAPNIDRY